VKKQPTPLPVLREQAFSEMRHAVNSLDLIRIQEAWGRCEHFIHCLDSTPANVAEQTEAA
jgi:hypothetical protein